MNSEKTAPGDLARRLATIGLRYLPDHLEDFVARATKASWTAAQIIERSPASRSRRRPAAASRAASGRLRSAV